MVEAGAVAEDPAWLADFEAAVDWVSNPTTGKRRDLWSTPTLPDLPEYQATPSIKLGVAMLAHRWYARRLSPMGASQNVEFGGTEILRQDPDVAKLLGIGVEGPFVFGAGTTLITVDTTTP